jgi:hypothetical protein
VTNDSSLLFEVDIRGDAFSFVNQVQLNTSAVFYSFTDIQESGIESLYLGTAESTLIQVDLASFRVVNVLDLTEYGVNKGDFGDFALKHDAAHTAFLTANLSVAVITLTSPLGRPQFQRIVAPRPYDHMPWCALIADPYAYFAEAAENDGGLGLFCTDVPLGSYAHCVL